MCSEALERRRMPSPGHLLVWGYTQGANHDPSNIVVHFFCSILVDDRQIKHNKLVLTLDLLVWLSKEDLNVYEVSKTDSGREGAVSLLPPQSSDSP